MGKRGWVDGEEEKRERRRGGGGWRGLKGRIKSWLRWLG